MPLPNPPNEQLPLPLYRHAVFFDWYGTLSTSRFWETITDSDTHPLSTRLKPAVDNLFTERSDLIIAWMRGQATDADVCTALDVELPRRYRADYLHRALLQDCRAASAEPALVEIASTLRNEAYVAIASDNMSCFADAPPAILFHRLRVDDLLVSSQIGALKAEDPAAFFGPFLTERQLGFEHALLIDDCAKTCAVFSRLGGEAIHYRDPHQLGAALNEWAPTEQLRRRLQETIGGLPSA